MQGKKAKQYFELACENGYACSFAIDMIENETPNGAAKSIKERNANNEMRRYAESVLSLKIPIESMYKRNGDYGKIIGIKP